ncbi:aldo/keto reductase [Mycobacterium sp. GA-2829]|uniref:aldo/keto reductase n=1 Tax=Mycobacterium sp. GA-2829 TaxID=1772283 RepID=UPI00073FC963|nr:aldo/keto reductase [Mycobacterium sp. GA-2829]KUI29285.1 alcohol dehydrogenase [Mycobacterium sp. GA-2829]
MANAEPIRLGTSGLQISPIVLGCMSFGDPSRGRHSWVLDEDTARPLLIAAMEAGITTLDTANEYSSGSSEEVIGNFVADVGSREQFIIATKLFAPMRPGPNGYGLSRRAVMEQVDASLRRLRCDWIDLYQIHRFDPTSPIEETMEALHDVVKAGKVRYIGASSMWTWQFARMQHTAELHGWTRFVSMQDQYNLVQREEEREMHPYCLASGVGVLPWSPLARGRLTRDWDDASTARASKDEFGRFLYRQAEESDRAIAAAVARIAEQRGVSRAQIALAWVRQQAAVSAPIVGVTKPHHLDDAVASLQIRLSQEELTMLTEPYTPRRPEGF